jgi:hypothetical protein
MRDLSSVCAIAQADDGPSSLARIDRTPSECHRCHDHHTGRARTVAVRLLSVNRHQNGPIETNTHKRNC